ncbi:hypothetical protein IMSAGC017_00570 [Thomasclavelia cocleata]|uniref:Uncharacterized protein n=1 Tax=Thomasclavelia cocleata TaxID=69824 RepID=A0A829Z8W9_9FIRM|nr:hypothetical protein IMSAGC017_00570 [Thomasclavelia cocleata]
MYCPSCGKSANSVIVSIFPSNAAPLSRQSSATPHDELIPISLSNKYGPDNSFELTSNLVISNVTASPVLLINLTYRPSGKSVLSGSTSTQSI